MVKKEIEGDSLKLLKYIKYKKYSTQRAKIRPKKSLDHVYKQFKIHALVIYIERKRQADICQCQSIGRCIAKLFQGLKREALKREYFKLENSQALQQCITL